MPEKFTRQKPLGGYVVDFYCSRLRLVIESDGDAHFTEELGRLNLRVLRFTNADVMRDFEGVCLRIRQAIGGKT